MRKTGNFDEVRRSSVASGASGTWPAEELFLLSETDEHLAELLAYRH